MLKSEAFELVIGQGMLLVAIGLLVWAIPKVSMPELLSQPANRPADAAFLPYFMAALTAMVGFWATLALNIPDLSRYARDQKAQIRGQFLGLPTTMTLFSFIGIAVTPAATSCGRQSISRSASRMSGTGVWRPVITG